MSKIPILEIINIEKNSASHIAKQLSLLKFGTNPYAFHLKNIPPEEHFEVAQNISSNLQTLGVRSYFPYPILLISEHLKEFDELPIVKNENSLPKHFLQKGKKLKNKEASLMNKVQLLSLKIENYNGEQKLEDLKKIMSHNRTLYNLSKELHFYQCILEETKKSS